MSTHQSLAEHTAIAAQTSIAEQIREDGYAIVKQAASLEMVDEVRAMAIRDQRDRVQPFELEADTNYPGSPESRDAPGGHIIRRLLMAHARGPVFTRWLQSDAVAEPLRALYGSPFVCPLAHHNCIMTKEPAFSSDTGWHQDVRYWSFERQELVSVWLALGAERSENGGLRVVPRSHAMSFQRDQFDDDLFFRSDYEPNKPILDTAIAVDLDAGDALFFHARTLHAASRNTTSDVKVAAVFTFRPTDNPPKPETRSASLPELWIR